MSNPPNPAPEQDPKPRRRITDYLPELLFTTVVVQLMWTAYEPWFQQYVVISTIVMALFALPYIIKKTRQLLRHRRRARSPSAGGTSLEGVADELAAVVRDQWLGEATRLGFGPDSPNPIDVPWRTSEGRGGAWGERTGSLTDLPALFKGGNRLVVLGDASTGKTSALIHLTLTLLADREQGSGLRPVPVLFPLADWNPDQALEDWLVDNLADQHVWLASIETGRDLPARLIREGIVLPVLDALDEIPKRGDLTAKDLQRKVIEAIRGSTLPFPGLLLSCRKDEYFDAEGSDAWLRQAVVIELLPLTPGQIRDHLRTAIPTMRQPAWEAVFAALDGPSAVTEALATPLILSLTPVVYADGRSEPGALARFTDADRLRAHVLRQFAPTRFDWAPSRRERKDGRVPREQAMRWLQFLASETGKDGKWEAISWWELSMLARTPTRIAACALGFLLSFAAVGLGGLVFFGEMGLTRTQTRWAALLLGLIGGIALGVVCYRNRPPKPAETQVKVDGRHLLAALKSGVPIFLFAALIGVLMQGPLRGVLIGLCFAVPIATMYALVAPDPEPRATNPVHLLRRDLSVGWVFAVAYGVPAFVVGGLATGNWWLGAAFGAASALSGALLYGVQWFFAFQGGKAGAAAFVHLALAVLALAPRNRIPWRVIKFLEEAHRCGILRRQAGGTYEFRHANVAAAIARWGDEQSIEQAPG